MGGVNEVDPTLHEIHDPDLVSRLHTLLNGLGIAIV